MKKLYLTLLLLPVAFACVLPALADKKPLSIRIIEAEINDFENADTTLYRLTYDSQGRVDSIVITEQAMLTVMRKSNDDLDSAVCKFDWQPGKVIVRMSALDEEPEVYTYTLDDKGRATAVTTSYEGITSTLKYAYNDAGFLCRQYADGSGNEEFNITYDDAGDMTKVTGYQSNWPYSSSNFNTTVQPSAYLNTGSLFIPLSELVDIDMNPVMCLAGLGGKATTHLPVSMKRVSTGGGFQGTLFEREYFYTFDADNYPTHIEERMAIGEEDDMMWYLDITWSENKGVAGIPADSDTITVEGRQVTADGTLTAYDMQGRVVASSPTGTLTLPSAGIYLLRTATATRKVAVR